MDKMKFKLFGKVVKSKVEALKPNNTVLVPAVTDDGGSVMLRAVCCQWYHQILQLHLNG